MLALIEDADTVELKLTVPESSQRSAVRSLKLDPLQARIRQVYFLDTPELDLNRQGVVVRARRTQGAPDDSVVKLRPVVPSQFSKSLRENKNFGIEVDALPGGYVCSASFKGRLGSDDVQRVAAGRRAVHKLFGKGQRKFYETHAPEGIELDDLSLLGPINVLKLKYSPEGGPKKLVAELWLYPDGARILEFSTKCRPDEAFQVSAESRAFLFSRGVDLTGEQQTKTATALAFFSAEVREAAAS